MTRGNQEVLLTRIGIHAVLILVSLTCLFPLFWMLLSSLKTQDTIFNTEQFWPAALHFRNYARAWKFGHFGTYFLNSVTYTLITISFLVLFSSMAAFAFSRLRFPGKDLLFYMFLGVMMIPIPGAFVALFVILNKLGMITRVDWLNRLGYILPQINAGLPFSIYLLKTFFDRVPKELEDSARIDGCNKWQIYWHIALPLARPAIAVIVIFQTLTVWNEYLLAKLVLTHPDRMPLQVGLMKFHGERFTQYPELMAGMAITMIPIVLIYLFMHKYIIKGITQGALTG
jgi:multiple sugar transport system permease protein/raffinose/stachyose/melibiose transport system permease protein